jgi:hypothetical protein
MTSPDRTSTQTDGMDVVFFSIPQEVLLQLSTGPMLLALLGAKSVASTLEAIGQASEEVFRGDRLPLLKFPVEAESRPDVTRES